MVLDFWVLSISMSVGQPITTDTILNGFNVMSKKTSNLKTEIFLLISIVWK